MKTVKMELFRAGSQTDSSGHTKEWTEKDLDKIVSQFKSEGDEVPATLGHKVTDAPAFAWFKKVWRDGNTLFGEMGDIVPEFATMLKNKMFKNRSIALRPDLSLRHIAFLGAERPAIKGLENFAFKAEDEEFTTIEFSENDETILTAIKETITNLFTKELKPEDSEMAELEEAKLKIAELEKSNGEFSEKVKTLESEKETISKELETEKNTFSEYKENQVKSEFSAYLDKQIEAGKIFPANKEANLKLMLSLNGQESLDYAEGDETVKKSQVDVFKANLESAKEVINFSETATKDKSASGDASVEISRLVKEKMDKSEMSYSNAFREVQSENPELVKKYEINTVIGGK